ncbi:MAG: antitoxin MazE-like protein [Reyranella sp.]
MTKRRSARQNTRTATRATAKAATPCRAKHLASIAFDAECRRQSRLVSRSPHEPEIMSWIEEVSDRRGW